MITLASKVYYSPAWLSNRKPSDRSGSIIRKLQKLLFNSGFSEKINNEDLVCIKTNFGDPGNPNVLRPVIYRTIVEVIRQAGGRPFLAETCGHGYFGHKKSAEAYLEAATWHGLTIGSVRAPLVMLDGFWGVDGVKVRVNNGLVLDEAWIARGILNMDHVVSLSHFKGHSPYTRGESIAASLKNLGIGLTTKTGKFLAHFDPPLHIDKEKCDRGSCTDNCLSKCPAPSAIEIVNNKARINERYCLLCGNCKSLCPLKAFYPEGKHSEVLLQKYIADISRTVIDLVGEDRFTYINVAYDIVTGCDCRSLNSIPIVPDIGILVSNDPVAIDRASLDLVNKAAGIMGTEADILNCKEPGETKFDDSRLFEFCQAVGLGTADYELIYASPEEIPPLTL